MKLQLSISGGATLRLLSPAQWDLFRSLAMRGLGVPLAFAANLLIARLLGPAEYGAYLVLLSTGLLAGGVAVFGVNRVLTREIAKSVPASQALTLRMVYRWGLRFTAVTSLLAMVVVLLWLTAGLGVPKVGWVERVLTALVVPTSLVSILAAGVLLGLGSTPGSQALDNVIKNGALLLGVLCLYALAWPAGAGEVLGIQVIAFSLAGVIGALWVRRLRNQLPVDGASALPVEASDVEHATWRRSAGHFFAGSAAVLLLGRLDIVLVNALGGETVAGLFGAAIRLAQVAGVAGMVLMAWLQPRFARAVAEQKDGRIRHLVWRGMLASFGLTAAVVLIGWLLAFELMELMGAGFEQAVWPFRWLLLSYLAWGLAVPGYALLAMSGHEAMIARVSWAQFFGTVGLTFYLVPSFGALGGAWAYGAGMFGASGTILMLTRRHPAYSS